MGKSFDYLTELFDAISILGTNLNFNVFLFLEYGATNIVKIM